RRTPSGSSRRCAGKRLQIIYAKEETQIPRPALRPNSRSEAQQTILGKPPPMDSFPALQPPNSVRRVREESSRSLDNALRFQRGGFREQPICRPGLSASVSTPDTRLQRSPPASCFEEMNERTLTRLPPSLIRFKFLPGLFQFRVREHHGA